MDYKEIVSSNIRRALDEKGKSQKWLADQVDSYPSHISKWLTGDSMPKPHKFEQIANALGLSVHQLLSGNFGKISGGKTTYTVEISTEKSFEADYTAIMNLIDQIIESDDFNKKQALRKKITDRLKFMFDFYNT